MKTLALMLASGAIYATIAETLSQAINNHGMNGDDRFAFFLIGLGAGLFASHRFGWLD